MIKVFNHFIGGKTNKCISFQKLLNIIISFEKINSGFLKNLLESSDIWWNPWKSVNAINNATMLYALGANSEYWRNWKKRQRKVAWLAVQNVPLNKILKKLTLLPGFSQMKFQVSPKNSWFAQFSLTKTMWIIFGQN